MAETTLMDNGRQTMQITTGTLDASRVIPYHDVQDADKLAAMVSSIKAGHALPRCVVIDLGDGDIQAVSGSHRIAAHKAAGVGIAVYIVTPGLEQYDDARLCNPIFYAAADDWRAELLNSDDPLAADAAADID